MSISPADLLQANIALIVGIFILLTISILSKKAKQAIVILVILTAMPFIISCGFLMESPEIKDWTFGVAKTLFVAGLAYTIVTLGIIAVIISREPSQSSS